MDKAIITECFIDTNLLETLVPTKIGYNKQHGCNNVVNLMKGNLKDKFALGIVDRDKRELDYLKEFEILDEVSGCLLLWKHTTIHHYIIQIVPEVEPWLIKIVYELGIDLLEYNLPNDLNGMYKYAKKKSSKNDSNLRRLFYDFGRRDHIALKKLTHWIKYLKEKNYNTDINKLING